MRQKINLSIPFFKKYLYLLKIFKRLIINIVFNYSFTITVNDFPQGSLTKIPSSHKVISPSKASFT